MLYKYTHRYSELLNRAKHTFSYSEQSVVTLIQCMQHSKNRQKNDSCTATAQHSWNALLDRNRMQCERSDPLTWVRKKTCNVNAIANGVCVIQALD